MMGTEWEIEFAAEMGLETTASPAVFAGGTPAYMYGIPTAESLRIEDLFDFTNHDLFPSSSSSCVPTDATGHVHPAGQEFSSAAVVGLDSSFTDDIYIPNEDAAELEWLSKFVEDSFSENPYQYSIAEQRICENTNFPAAEISTPGRTARSKTFHDFSSSASSSSSSSSSSTDFSKGKVNTSSRKKQGNIDCGARRCTHCASEKTPQWRTGPLGPKTLCNACGVRFKSGRLVPEYRPAASPTFVLTQHSNSHRKVMELRRQKEFLILRGSGGIGGGGGGSAAFSPEMLFHDYEVC